MKVKLSIKIEKKRVFERGMVVGARRTGLSILETAVIRVS